MDSGVKVPLVGGRYTMGRGVDMPLIGGYNAMGSESIYHG